MAPADTPGRKKRETQYFEPGVVGRRTGITLHDTGVRDEFGLEPAEGIFSSPAKQAPRSGRAIRGAHHSDGTLSTSEAMDVGRSSAPEPTEVLSARRALPKSKTPLKTNLGATPRRAGSMGPFSTTRQSPARSPSRTPGRAATHSPVRRLDYSVDESRASASPRRAHDRAHERLAANGKGKRTNNVYDLPDSPARGYSPRVRSPLRNTIDESEVLVNGTHDEDDDHLPQMDDDEEEEEEDIQYAQEEEEIQQGDLVEDSQTQSPRRRGGKRKNDFDASQVADAEEPAMEEDKAAAQKKRPGRPRKNAAPEPVESERPAKRSRRSNDIVMATQSPAKSPSKSPAKAPAKSPAKPKGKPGRPRLPFAKKAANKKVTQHQTRGADRAPDGTTKPSVPARATQRELHLSADEEAENMGRTKSGRLTFKPLEHWRNERVVFENTGGMPSIRNPVEIAEIVRIQDATPIKRTITRRSSSAQPKRRRKTRSVFEDDLNDDGEEPWEGSQGVIAGRVRLWENGVAEADNEIDQQLAFADKRIQPKPTPDNPSFMFTKTLGMPFFGSGVIELPPGGSKGQKNSRRFQFVFWVHVGKVAVSVNGTRFVISKGGMFQVPRGNFYSISNESDHTAKLMFAQGCEAMTQLEESQLA